MGLELNRAEVGEEIEALSQGKYAAFRSVRHARIVPLGSADRAEQDGFGLGRGLNGCIGQAGAEFIDGSAADQLVIKLDGVAEPFGHRGQDLPGLCRNFGADAVAIQNDNRASMRAFP